MRNKDGWYWCVVSPAGLLLKAFLTAVTTLGAQRAHGGWVGFGKGLLLIVPMGPLWLKVAHTTLEIKIARIFPSTATLLCVAPRAPDENSGCH